VITLPDLEIRLSTHYARVAIQNLTNHRIGTSRSLLIPLGARSLPFRVRQAPIDRNRSWVLILRAPPGLQQQDQLNDVGRSQRIPVTYESGRYTTGPPPLLGTYWLLLSDAVSECGRAMACA
jgi:hypothetical protein